MNRSQKVALAATILLMPGGFILGAALLGRKILAQRAKGGRA